MYHGTISLTQFSEYGIRAYRVACSWAPSLVCMGGKRSARSPGDSRCKVRT